VNAYTELWIFQSEDPLGKMGGISAGQTIWAETSNLLDFMSAVAIFDAAWFGRGARLTALCAGLPTPYTSDRRSPQNCQMAVTIQEQRQLAAFRETSGRWPDEVRRPAPSAPSGDVRFTSM
jgi:hypothetical protein